MSNLKKKISYMLQMHPLLKKEALFSSETEQFLTPSEPEPGDLVRIRFRTYQHNVDAVYLVHNGFAVKMDFQKRSDCFDYYITEVIAPQDAFRYCFRIEQGATYCYYDKLGVSHDGRNGKPFAFIPGFHTPEWAKGAVMYQIFTDRFYNGDKSNDVQSDEYSYIDMHVHHMDDWHRPPEAMDVRNFYGGDLQGIMDKLDYLDKLGIEVLYLNPVFVSPSNHKYDIQDYDYIDPHIGRIVKDSDGLLNPGDDDNRHADKYICRVTKKENLRASNQLFIQLVEEAHKRGMRVILDGVFNHCGSFNKWMDRERIYEGRPGYADGAFVSEFSPYHDYFEFYPGHEWPYNEYYDGWWGHNTLPKLNYEESEKLQKEVLEIGRKWVSAPYNVDGWRLDVAADLGHTPEFNHKFWKKFRQAVKEANPEAIILAEHYGDPAGWLQGDEWDTVMNYDAFMEPVSWFLTGMEKHSDSYRQDLWGNSTAFFDTMNYQMAEYTAPSLLTAMNELDNHDHSRFLTRTNHTVGRIGNSGSKAAEENVNKAVLRMAVVIQMTWPGAPTVYYGDEAGVCGFTDPDSRRTYPWGGEDKELVYFYSRIIALHKRYPVLKTGSLKFLLNDYGMIAYGRFDRYRQIIVLINTRRDPAENEVNVWPAGISMVDFENLTRVFYTDHSGFTEEPLEYQTRSGIIHFRMEPESAMILVHKRVKKDKPQAG